MPTPMAAAIGSSIRYVLRAPALTAASTTARSSTSVIPTGTQITTTGFVTMLPQARRTKRLSIFSVSP